MCTARRNTQNKFGNYKYGLTCRSLLKKDGEMNCGIEFGEWSTSTVRTLAMTVTPARPMFVSHLLISGCTYALVLNFLIVILTADKMVVHAAFGANAGAVQVRGILVDVPPAVVCSILNAEQVPSPLSVIDKKPKRLPQTVQRALCLAPKAVNLYVPPSHHMMLSKTVARQNSIKTVHTRPLPHLHKTRIHTTHIHTHAHMGVRMWVRPNVRICKTKHADLGTEIRPGLV
jgi:hypothetical protein